MDAVQHYPRSTSRLRRDRNRRHLRHRAPLMPDWPYANLTIKNTGETPARNVRNWTRVEVGRSLIQPCHPYLRMTFPAQAWSPAGSLFTIGKFMSRALAANEIPAIQGRTLALYVYGIVKYTDIFGKERESQYRLFHIGSWPPPAGTILLYAPEGNSYYVRYGTNVC
jgi:hypothetical protein